MPERWYAERLIDHVALCPAPQTDLLVGFAVAWFNEDGEVETDSWTCPVVALEVVTTHDYSKSEFEEGCFHPQRSHAEYEGLGWVYDGNYVNRGAIFLGECGRLCSTLEHENEPDGPVYRIFEGLSGDEPMVLKELEAEAISNLTHKKNEEEQLNHE